MVFKSLIKNFGFVTGFTIIVILGVYSSIYFRHQRNDQLKNSQLNLIRLINSTITLQDFDLLNGQESDLENPGFTNIRKLFTRLGNADTTIRYIYIMTKREGKVVFYMDSEPDKYNGLPTSEPLAVPGEVYDDMPPVLESVFQNGKPLTYGPYTDKWGTFISTFYPVKAGDGQLKYIIGVDMLATDWMGELRRSMLAPSVIFLLLLTIYLMVFVLLQNRKKNTEAIKEAYENLEFMVQQRTEELKTKNEELNSEIIIRTAAQHALSRSEKKYKDFADLLPQIVFETDEKGVFVFLNQTAYSIMGYSPEEHPAGLSVYNVIVPEEINLVKENIAEIIKSRKSKGNEYRLRKKDGSFFDGLIYSQAIFENDDFKGLRGLVVDISGHKETEKQLIESEQRLIQQNADYIKINEELKIALEKIEESENQLKQIANNLVKGMVYQLVAIDETTRKFTYISDTVEKFYGCTAAEARANANLVYGRIHKDDIQRIIQEENIALANMTVFTTEARVVNPNGEIRWSSFVSSPRNHKGLIYWDGIEFDITDQKNIVEELKNAKVKAEESDKLKTAFLCNMTHEIRTPMNGILGFSGLMANENLDADEKIKYKGLIDNCCNQLLSVVNDIIEVSKIETGQTKVNSEKFDLKNLINDIYIINKEFAQKKNLNLILEEEFTGRIITSDEIKLKQILTNLLSNAIKFTNAGYIKIKCCNSDTQISIEVEDTGIGIMEEEQGIIFNRFIQSEIDVNKELGGTGLGLSISKSYAELLGGTISLKSKHGIGSKFTLTFPACFEDLQGFKKEKLINDLDLSGKTVLIAEDNMVNYLVLKNIMLKTKANIIHANNGKEVVDFINSNEKIDIILMDIRMPEMNGYEATIYVKQKNPKIPVIAQTAYAFIEEKQKAIECGCNAVVAKPIDKDELFTLISKYLS